LELKSGERKKGDDTRQGFITVRLNTDGHIDAIAISNAHQDIERSEILRSADAADSQPIQVMDTLTVVPQANDFLKALESVISKLDVFVQIIDQTSKVSACCRYTENCPHRDNRSIRMPTLLGK
jgi:hypothetical protein